MRAIETVARAFAHVEFRARNGDHADAGVENKFIEKNWHGFECKAAALLRALKDQPPHVCDAASERFLQEPEWAQLTFDAMLEAMARA